MVVVGWEMAEWIFEGMGRRVAFNLRQFIIILDALISYFCKCGEPPVNLECHFSSQC